MHSFDEIINRRNSESVKWDLYPGTLPMWVADMDFRTAPPVLEALQKRLDHGVFGYELVPEDYYTAIAEWFAHRHHWKGIQKENIVYTTGVIAAYSAAIKAMTRPGDRVLVQTPCYNAFFPAISNNKCRQLENPLHYENGRYTVDWEDFERKTRKARVFLLCNPHNPAGRVWTKKELTRMGEICLRNKVFVVSDEIHCELTFPGHPYTPFATLPEELVRNSVSCISPTKAFNMAGIQIANIYARDPEIVKMMDRAINENECCDVNVFGVAALKAAYNHGGEWLDDLREYLLDNARTVFCYLEDTELPIVAVPLEGTYLMWLDCRGVMHPGEPLEGFSERFAAHLKSHQLVLSPGTLYGAAGEGFMRLNIACPRTLLLEGLKRFKTAVETY